MMPDKKMAPESLGRVLVLGLGKSGKSVARYCASLLGTRVDSVFIAAGAYNPDAEAFVQSLACEGVTWAFGDDALEGVTERFDVCIPSPGIPYWERLYADGKRLSSELISEVEFAWRESAADSVWVAITGTNGKTTTTALAAHLLQHAGLQANAVGNIGDVCLEAVLAGKTRVYVAEVSSYQLASTVLFAPDVAVLLNITPDHVHWHKTLEAYRDAKFKLIDNVAASAKKLALTEQASAPVAILDAMNDVVRAKVRELKAIPDDERGFAYIPMGTADGITGDMRAKCGAANAAFLADDGTLRVAFGGVEHVLGPASALQIKGEHNASNALAAASVAVALGVPDEIIAEGLASFAPLEHRIEPCGSIAGVTCYNDSKATNTDSTVKALAAFPGQRPIVLLGGDDKGTDLSELVAMTYAHARAAVCFGAGAARFFEALEPGVPEGFALVRAGKMEEALDAALELARPGDIVLLSPACASFDEFTSFEERGRVFKDLVAARRKERGA